jgi:hypothetical protein
MNIYFLGLLVVDKERKRYKINLTSSFWTGKRKNVWVHPSSKLINFSVIVSLYEEIGVSKINSTWELEHSYWDPEQDRENEEPNGESEPYSSKKDLNFHLQQESNFRGKNFLLRVDDSWLSSVQALLS